MDTPRLVDGPWRRTARGAGLLGADGAVAPTIFAEMSALALTTGALNLGQGFPDTDGPAEVLDAATAAIRDGHNQYPPGIGVPVLRTAIAEHQQRFHGVTVDPDTEVLVTAGATEALAAAILAFVREGDEVLTLEPFYDAYGALIALAGGVHRTVPLTFTPDGYRLDAAALEAAVTDTTRAILVNTPHNPTGMVLRDDELALIARLAERHDALLITDEVYEHLTYGVEHRPPVTFPGAAGRTISISSGGKTFSATGWKIGWVTAPRPLRDAIMAVKQFLTYVSGGPFQHGIAAGLRLPDAFFDQLRAAYTAKRDLLAGALREAGFTVALPDAGYFIVADAAPLGYDSAVELCRTMPHQIGVVGVPISAFHRPETRPGAASLVRFAFCKRDDVLRQAADRLTGLRR